MSDVMDEVLHLDSAGDYQEIINSLLRKSSDAMPIVSAITHLLKHDRFDSAGYLGNALVRVGIDHPVAHIGRAFGSLTNQDAALAAEVNASLSRQYDAMEPGQQAVLYNEIINPTLLRLISAAHIEDNGPMLLQILDLLKSCAPALRRTFDWSAQPTRPVRGDPQKLIAYRSPPTGAPRVPYRVVVAARRKVFPQFADSRDLDIGPRFVAAASRYGWSAQFCPLNLIDVPTDFVAIIEHCRTFAAEILIFDDAFLQSEPTYIYRRHVLAALRQALPSIRIVALYLDSWQIPPAHLRHGLADVDAIWATTPAMPHWAEPMFHGKVLQAPLAHAGNILEPDETIPDRIGFVGRLTGYNVHRLFWRAAATVAGLPIGWYVTFDMADGVPPLEGYADYMRRLAATGCTLNLAMRNDLSCVITDRSFEALLAGTLLIQEYAPDLDYFFVAGEHYLPIHSFVDLQATARTIAEQRNEMQEIRRAGHAFAVARYADDKLFGYLDALLFHPVPDGVQG